MLKLLTLAIRHHFSTKAPTAVQIIYDNAPQTKIDQTKPFIRFSVRPGASKPISTGDNPLIEMIGRIEMSIFVPVEQGDAQALDLADQCEAIFRNYCWQVPPNRLLVEGFDRAILPEQNWYQIKVSALWRAIMRPER